MLRLKIETVGPSPDAYPGEPLLVFCRHAGPGDSFTLMYALMHWYGREPRVVLKETLAWDPALGRAAHPAAEPVHLRQARGRGRDVEAEVGDLARNLDENDAFVIFPEGGNFTPRATGARDRAAATGSGMHGMAERAEEMINVLAPRPGGVLAALDAAPEADVLLVAHTGLDHVVTIADVWHSLPMDKRLLMGWWRIPREEIPADREERIEWLFEWWRPVDEWVDEHRPVDLPRRRAEEPARPGQPTAADGARRRPATPWGGGPRFVGSGLLGLLDSETSTSSAGRVRRGDRVRLLGGVGERLAGGGTRRRRRLRSAAVDRNVGRVAAGHRCGRARRCRGRGRAPGSASTTSASWPTRRHRQLLYGVGGERRPARRTRRTSSSRSCASPRLTLERGGRDDAAALGLLGDHGRGRPPWRAAAPLLRRSRRPRRAARGCHGPRPVGVRSRRALRPAWARPGRGPRRAWARLVAGVAIGADRSRALSTRGASSSRARSTWGVMASVRSWARSWACSTNFSLRLLVNMGCETPSLRSTNFGGRPRSCPSARRK